MQLVRVFAAICLGFIASLSLQGCSKTEEDTTAATATVTATTTATGETVTATATMTSTMTMTSTSTVTPAAWSERGDAGGIWGGFVTLQPLSLWVFCLAINLQFSRQKVVRARLPKVDRWMLEWSVWRPFSYMSLISTFGILLGSLLWLGALWWTLAHWCTTMFLNCRSAGGARRCSRPLTQWIWHVGWRLTPSKARKNRLCALVQGFCGCVCTRKTCYVSRTSCQLL